MKQSTVRKIVFAAMTAALYAALTLGLAPVGFGPIQFRLSEVLCVLPFLFPSAAPGLFIGCLLANIISPYGALDMIFGSAATLLAALCTMLLGRENSGVGRKLLACFPPVFFNAVMIGAVIAITGAENGSFGALFAINAFQVGLSEAVVVYGAGFPLLMWLPKTRLYRSIREKFQ